MVAYVQISVSEGGEKALGKQTKGRVWGKKGIKTIKM